MTQPSTRLRHPLADRRQDPDEARWNALDLGRFGGLADAWEEQPLEHWRAAWRLPALVGFGRVTSTNDVARVLAEAGAPAGTVVLADEQSAGRGRAGKSWWATPGSSLLLSVILRPPGPFAATRSAVTPLLVGIIAAQAIEQVTLRSAAIKWPNDILLDGLKVAGILCESTTGGPAGESIVAGIGINISQDRADLPDEWAPAATSLSIAAGTPVPRPAVAAALLEQLIPLTTSAYPTLDPAALEQITRRDALFGRAISVDHQSVGTACGIAPDGALIVQSATGARLRIRAGSVRILNP